MNNQRHRNRIKAGHYLRVFNDATGDVVGHAEDISPDGLLVISERPIPSGTVVKLRIEVMAEDEHREAIHVRGRSVWTRQHANAGFYDIGLQLIGPSQEAARKINDLIDPRVPLE